MFYPPAGIGSGKQDVTVAMDAVKEVGAINRDGLNLLAHIRSKALFEAPGSRFLRPEAHSLKIVELDLWRKIVTFEVASNPQVLSLALNESVKVDLDGDGIPDMSVEFAGVYINRAELTVKSLLFGDGALPINDRAEELTTQETGPDSRRFVFTRNLETGMIHPDVKELQKFLNNNGFIITPTGPGSPGQETDKFGAFTRQALIRYQIAKGLSPAAGYFGDDTRAMVNQSQNGQIQGHAPDRLLGRILLQVEEHGEAWYVRTGDAKRYYLADGDAAYAVMRHFSLGITDADLAKIPAAAEVAELKNSSSVCGVNTLASRLKGRILLQVQKNGEAWYVDPVTCRAVYLADGQAAYQIMRYLGLGITNSDLAKIQIGNLSR